ncbi:beta-glucuronosyltransferase GlcAT14A-like [Panicum miliaceum]|uniref:Beta-glucuronosyltransferase GlcAT14A-like n=1 Tax=Panicum miliaceum TaxID=4540 RepID=A0A3L6Q7U7_PANMI|nr:beta-glucuronosyltransferase GlcAT14A-like [Panicum miliaceum]
MRPRRLPPCLAVTALSAALLFLLLLLCASSFPPLVAWRSSAASRAAPPPPPRAEWGPGRPPSFAYWISGTGGDARRVLRLLRAVYHPRNRYLLHLDAAAAAEEREALAQAVRRDEPAWREFRNVDVVGEGHAIDRTGSSALAAVLHGAAVLLRIGAHWDWLVTLSAEDYPLVTQDGEKRRFANRCDQSECDSLSLCRVQSDPFGVSQLKINSSSGSLRAIYGDLLYAFSSVPRDLNFIDHTSDLGWKRHERFEKIIVDPSLYMDRNTEPYPSKEIRQMPDAFQIFTGSPWVILSRNFAEHCVHGWDNLPRKLLMYFANTAYSMESYFQTLICNSSDFRNTTVNGDLRYFVWDNPPGLDPLVLNETHYENMVNSSAAFARRFEEDTPMLKKMDDELLNRSPVQLVPGVWCPNLGKEQNGTDAESCSKWGDINTVRPGHGGERLRQFISEISQTRGCS